MSPCQPSTPVWLIVAPLVACAADVTLTLLGQPASYWRGDRASVSEFNPAARLLLSFHPMLFVIAGVVTSGIVVAVALYGPRRLAFAVSVLVTVGHAIAAGAWLTKLGPVGWVAAIVFLLLLRATMPGRSRGDSKRPSRIQNDESGIDRVE